MIKDYKVAFPDPNEKVSLIVPLYYVGYEPFLRIEINTKYIIDDLVIFRPVIFLNREIIYKLEYTFFRHLN